MQAVVIDKPGDVSVGEIPDPVPGPEEVVVAVRASGICGTDLWPVGTLSLSSAVRRPSPRRRNASNTP